jgi:late competence protein required for DNA uptake (superfamily II DNA/RNA helicase)
MLLQSFSPFPFSVQRVLRYDLKKVKQANTLYIYITKSKEQSPSSEVDSHSATQ